MDKSIDETADAEGPGLPDGSYEVLVVDIAVTEADELVDASVAIEVVITQGQFKGEVSTVEFSGDVDETEALDALALPGVLVVHGGCPKLHIEEPEAPSANEPANEPKL